MANPVKIGLVGLGRAGWGMHIEELKGKEDQCVIVAACDILPERRKAMQERFPSCHVYEKIEDLINDPEVELVSIATRSVDHYRHVRMALEAGKDVLGEKPMCMTYKQALELKRLSEEEEKCGHLYIRHNRRFEPNFLFARDLINSGKLGDVYEIRLARNGYQRRDDWQTISDFGGGQMLNWGPHIVDHSLRFLESPLKSMSSWMRQVAAGGDCEDHLKLVLEGENGRIVDMEISGGCALPVPEYRIYGSRGSCVIENNVAHLRYIDPEQILPEVVSDPGTPVQYFGKSGTFEDPNEPRWIEEDITIEQFPLDQIWGYLHDAIKGGKPFPITLEEAVEVIHVIDMAKSASDFDYKPECRRL